MNSLKIRKAQVDDLKEIQEIARQTIDKCYRSFLGDEGVDWFINSGESNKEIQKYIGNCDVLLVDDKIAAFTVYFGNFIHLMMVDSNLHRSGFGSMLLAHTENQLFSQGNSTLRLETFKGNNQAISFYLKNGWTITKEQEDEEHDFIRIFFEKKA